jgi:hypothetical protein
VDCVSDHIWFQQEARPEALAAGLLPAWSSWAAPIETGRKRLTPMIQPAIGSGVPDVGFGPARGRWNASDAMSFVSTWTFFINSTSQTSGGSLR